MIVLFIEVFDRHNLQDCPLYIGVTAAISCKFVLFIEELLQGHLACLSSL